MRACEVCTIKVLLEQIILYMYVWIVMIYVWIVIKHILLFKLTIPEV